MQQIIPNAKAQFIDSGGQPLASGTVGFYFPGTLNPKPTFQDAAGTIANTNPVPLDSRGQALIWGSGVYRQILKDASGVTIWDQITEDPNAGLTGSLTDAVFTAGDGTGDTFIPGTTTQLTLPAGPGTIANTWIFFDGVYQADDQIASLDGVTLTFNSPIPNSTQLVTVKIGTTIAVGTPGAGAVTDSSVAQNAGINASKLSFLQNGVGAVKRTVLSKLQDVVSVKDFGAKGDGTTDDTAAMQAAHNTGRLVYYPAGTYVFSTITMTAGGIIGEGYGVTILSSTDVSNVDLIAWNGVGGTPGSLDSTKTAPLYRDFKLIASTSKTGGASINLIPSTGEICFALVDGVLFSGGWVQFGTVAAAHWRVCNSIFLNYMQAGCLAQNTGNVDSGDSTIEGCTFNCGIAGAATQSAVLQFSSGGLRVENNKMLGGAFGYLMQAKLAAQNMADLLFEGNSVENMLVAGMQFNRASGTAQFGNIVISGNEFGQNANHIIMNDVSGFLVNISILDNDFNTIPNGGFGVIYDSNTNGLIAGNRFSGGASSAGISAGSAYTRLHIGINQYNVGTPYGFGLPAQTIVDLSAQGGAGVVTTSSTYGSMFIGTVHITFPSGFALPPQVYGATISGTGSAGVACIVTNVTAAGMDVSPLSLVNGASVGFQWFAQGTSAA